LQNIRIRSYGQKCARSTKGKPTPIDVFVLCRIYNWQYPGGQVNKLF